MAPLVVLVGPPGAGKSTVGASLAERLRVGFRDTDADVERAMGMPVQEIFLIEGEAAFRRAESAAVTAALADQGVVAVGGGAVESPEVRRKLADHFVVRLAVGAAEAAKRVGITGSRPMLLGNVRSQWTALMDRRGALYAEVSNVTVDTARQSVAAVVDQIIDALEASADPPEPVGGPRSAP